MANILSGPAASVKAPPVGLVKLVRLSWSEARPVVQVIFQLRFLSGVGLAALGYARPEWYRILAGGICWLLAVWGIYLLNGIADVREDQANHSRRPVARGDLSATTATTVVIVLAIAALMIGASISMWMLLLAATLLAVGWAYSMGPYPLKSSVPGVFVSVTLGGMLTYLAGWVSTGASSLSPQLLVFATALSLWMGVGGMSKELSDISGDRIAGRRTLPIVLGENRARALIALMAVSIGGTFATLTRSVAPVLTLPSILVMCGSVVLAMCVVAPVSRGNRSQQRRPYRIFMMTQYLAHLGLLWCFAR